MALYKGSKKIAGLIRGEDISHATEEHAGIIEIADQEEVLEGVIDSKAVTPKKMKDTLSDVAYSGEFNELLGKPTNLSDFNDDLGSSPVHTHNQYQETIEDLNEIRSNASSAKNTIDVHVANGTIHVTASDKIAWSQKQNAITDLEDIRNNAKTGADLAPQVATNTEKIEEIIVSRFPNVTIIGTPHIEGGQVSNYSDTNYLQFPFIDISRGQPFDIYFAFTTSNDVTTQQNILDSHFGIALAIQNGKGIIALSSNGTNWDIGSVTGTNAILPNTTYYAKLSWSGTEYTTALSTDDTQYLPDMRVNSNLTTYKTTIFIGGSPNIFGSGTAHPFKGTINFNKAKVVVNDLIVWQGMEDVGLATRANVSLDNLDDVGNAKFTTLGSELDYTNNELSLLNTNGETLSSVTINSSPNLDNITINKNNNEELQAIGTIEKNKFNAKYDWVGTKEEYNTAYEAGNIDLNWVCYITDDIEPYNSSANIDLNNISDNGIDVIKHNSYHPPLLSCMWSDHKLDDISWLRADTFSWQSGDVYKSVYDKLVEEYNNATQEGQSTHGFTFKISPNGFHIATVEAEEGILDKYNTFGASWFYIIDTINKRFKLPRTKFGFKGLRNNVGNDIAESLPNIRGSINFNKDRNNIDNVWGSFYQEGSSVTWASPSGTSASTLGKSVGFDATRSSSAYQDNAPVQERGTQMYLYFYAGEYTREAIEQTAGLTTELFNNKLDLNVSNLDIQGKNYVSSLGMPSSRYMDLTLGASGAQYTAPANGYFSLSASYSTSGYLYMYRGVGARYGHYYKYDANVWVDSCLVVKKGDIIIIQYQGTANIHAFRFVYAEGAN